MTLDIRTHLSDLFKAALEVAAPGNMPPALTFERPKQITHGDWACNIAMQLAKPLKKNPRELAQAIVAALPPSPSLAAVEIAGPGFINIRLAPSVKQEIVRAILQQGAAYGLSNAAAGQQALVEFVSANPTGPLHVGHGRQAALGDAIAAVLESQGWKVTREFYYNDAGVQIANLAWSVHARCIGQKPGDPGWPETAYNGEYIADIARAFLIKETVVAADTEPVVASADVDDLEAIRKFAVAYLRREQDIDLQAFGVKFDNYYLESSLYTEGRVDATVTGLIAAGKTYEQDGALWLKTTDYGDDKDRVMRKSDGTYTYFVPDVAYHVTKWQRGFKRVTNVQGSDHHGTIARVRAGLQALDMGIPQGYPDYVLHKMVTVMKGGEEVKISKRAGSYVTVRDLIDEVGRDAVRFFLVSRKGDAEFTFDIDLAKSQSEDNPVYYVQYAHARICSVEGLWKTDWQGDEASIPQADLSPLTGPRELALIQKLADYPDVLATAAAELSPHQVAFYLKELAAEFHSYYNAEKFLVSEADIRLARVALCFAVRQVLRNGLALLGVSAPEKM